MTDDERLLLAQYEDYDRERAMFLRENPEFMDDEDEAFLDDMKEIILLEDPGEDWDFDEDEVSIYNPEDSLKDCLQ